ncbi:MAG: hypothetical protein Q7J31_12365 [Syntrophales bacterium]|nr:hypothetical protein [Syntrophales bacterium]
MEKWRNSKEYKNSFSPMPVEDYRKMISLDIDIVTKAIREEKNHEPTISELKDGLVNWWMKIHRGEDLMITQRDFTFKEADEIIKQVSCIFR